MTFVSYAQNFEDVMLWRALQHVESGFYLDVGAWSPETDSITKAFYERGWRGINVEPNLEWHAILNDVRPDDINLAVALSDQPGEETFYCFGEYGLSTMDAAVATEHLSQGWQATRRSVPVTTLDDIWEKYIGPRAVHFLKIDVEGWEERVLRGNDWQRHRPWIVVVESTRPLSQLETHEAWETILTKADFSLAYQDGLNRYYVAVEHADLLPALKYPPNFFDHFVLARQHYSEICAREAEERAAAAEARATAAEAQQAAAEARQAAAEARAAEAEAKAAEAIAQLDALYRSKSWRLTRPLRWLKRPLSRYPRQ